MTEGTAGAANEKVRTVALLNSDAPIMSLFAEGHLLTGEGAAIVADASCPSNGIVAGRIGSTVLARMSGPGALKVNCSDGHAAQGLYAATYYTRRATGAYALDVALAMEGGLAAAYFNTRWLFGDAVFNRTDTFSVTPVSVKPTEPTATALAINDATALNLAWSAPENDGGRPGDSYSAALDRGVDLGALIVARALSGGVLRQQSKGRPTRQSELRYPKTQTCCSSPPANST